MPWSFMYAASAVLGADSFAGDAGAGAEAAGAGAGDAAFPGIGYVNKTNVRWFPTVKASSVLHAQGWFTIFCVQQTVLSTTVAGIPSLVFR
jgi:hypothetical protein